MIELGKHPDFELMSIVGYLSKSRHDLRVKDLNEFFIGPVRRMNTHLFGYDETNPAPSPLTPVILMLLAGKTVHGEIGEVRLKGQTVFHLDLANRKR
jgi:hypothetical protein